MANLFDIEEENPIKSDYEVDTVYQNTRSKKLLIIATTANGSSGRDWIKIRAYSDNATPPTTFVSGNKAGTGSNDFSAVAFTVPPDYYFKVEVDNGSIGRYESWEV